MQTIPPQQPDFVESWDDDGDIEGFDDIQLRAASTATSITSSSTTPQHRDSISSRLSTRSDLDSTHDEDWQVLVDDSKPTSQDAAASARAKGIPIPDNCPPSALVGGTIRKLGGKKIKRALGDDWSEDLDFPEESGQLKLTKPDEKEFAESLRQISAAFRKNPSEATDVQGFVSKTITPKNMPSNINLDSFKDEDEDDAFGDVPTIKIQKQRSQKPVTIGPAPPRKATKSAKELDSIERDIELPSSGRLELARRTEQPRTPHHDDDTDIEWAEGSLGTRNGGTRREVRSGRSSSISALSPSVSSCLTGESEDEGLDGLVLPNGPLKFDEALKKRQENASPDPPNFPQAQQGARGVVTKDDFFSGLEVGDGEVFDSAKLTLNKNIKHKTERQKSPTRRTATTLTFTSKTSQTANTRIPRPPHHFGHDRARSTLEPVSESGQPVPKYKRPESRMGHSAQSSVSSIPTPSTPSTPSAPSTPSRRGLQNHTSRDTLRTEVPTTTSAQLLRAKRSMPAMRIQSPTKPSSYARPLSRNEGSRLHIPSRPKTPTDRSESRLEALRRPPVPFLPAGTSQSQSHHVNTKSNRHIRQNNSDGSNEGGLPSQRSLSRLTNGRPETPGRHKSFAPPELAANAKRPITKPATKKNFGDGTELEIFDDLPTSATIESRFVRLPIKGGATNAHRNKLGQSLQNPSVSSIATSRTETPMPSTPLSPTKQELLPRFARDTAASRAAREQRQTSITVNPRDNQGGPLAPLTTNWRTRLAGLASMPQSLRRKNKEPAKPQLIRGFGSGANEAKSLQGMQYNPELFRWEGNENALAPFDIPAPALLTPTSPKPAPALITNVGSSATGVQISGGMVFDPQRMCWLKMAPTQHRESSTTSLRGGVGSVQLEEEEDVFAGLEDLKEEDESSRHTSRKVSSDFARRPEDAAVGGDSSDEFLVSEEFDVGPEFIRRQRAEEEKWQRKVDKWLRPAAEAEATDEMGRVEWRWAIRRLPLSS